jgi:tRNA-dihydrouridine synthase
MKAAAMNNFWETINKPITVLAPMEDVTDYVFREIVTGIAKPDVLFTEFTSSDALFTEGHDTEARKLVYSEVQRPIVAQVWGSTPENFYKTASYIRELKFDGIDINMGCPDKNVMKRDSGAALINNTKVAGKIIE